MQARALSDELQSNFAMDCTLFYRSDEGDASHAAPQGSRDRGMLGKIFIPGYTACGERESVRKWWETWRDGLVGSY